MAGLINPEPVVVSKRALPKREPRLDDSNEREPFDALEVFGHLREISDPEHPYTLEQACNSVLHSPCPPQLSQLRSCG